MTTLKILFSFNLLSYIKGIANALPLPILPLHSKIIIILHFRCNNVISVQGSKSFVPGMVIRLSTYLPDISFILVPT